MSLTTGSDAITGTAGDDMFSGARVDTIQTWSSSDSIAGGEGTDTLTAVINADVTPGVGAVTGVENLVVTAIGGATVDFSSSSESFITGVTSITNLSSTGAAVFSDITAIAAMSVENIASQTTLFEFNTSVLSGASDTLTLNLSGVVGAVTVGTNGDADGDYETLVVNATGANSDMVAGGGLGGDAATVTVNGTAAMDFGTAAGFANVETFNAAANSGGVTAVFAADGVSGTTNTKTITGGAGADDFDISAIEVADVGAVTVSMGAGDDTLVLGGSGAVDFTIDGGAGSDTLSVLAALSAVTHQNVRNFEVLHTNSAADLSLIGANNSITTVRVSDASAITNASAAMILEIDGGVAATDAISLAVTTDGSADSVTVNAVADGADVVAEALTLTLADAETVIFNTAAASLNLASADGNADTVLTDATSIVAVGNNDLVLEDVSGLAIATVDLTGLNATVATTGSTTDEGDFVARFSSNANMTITGNSSTSHLGTMNVTTTTGADTIIGTNNNDVFSSGAGADILIGLGGDDDLNGGGGNDTLTGGAGSDDFHLASGSIDSITDFTKASGTVATDQIEIDLITGTGNVGANAQELIETTGAAPDTVANGAVVVLTGDNFIDVSSATNSTDITAIQAALNITSNTSTGALAAANVLAIFKADTDGDNDADEVQIWLLNQAGSTGAVTTASTTFTGSQIGVLTGYSVSADLAADFLASSFEF